MKRYNDYVVGDKVLAKATDDLDHPIVIAGKIVSIQSSEGSMYFDVDWDNYGVHTYRPTVNFQLHQYETEAEKLALTLKLL